MDVLRYLNLSALLQKKSHFLLGPRGTGKSYLIRQQLKKSAHVVDLLRSENLLRLAAHPEDLEKLIIPHLSKKKPYVVIDEIQKLPILLNEVHRLIEERRLRFLLTGSSARKLRSQGINLLAGRAWPSELFPLVSHEIADFNLERYIRFGGLPSVYLSQNPQEELSAYIDTYIKEEVLTT